MEESIGRELKRHRSGDRDDTLQQVRVEGKLCDVVFIVKRKRFTAHRNIFAAASSVFEATLTNGMSEKVTREVHLGELLASVWSSRRLSYSISNKSWKYCSALEGLKWMVWRTLSSI